jgi:putative spermidine/putrescine transport system ATP-binding protein
MLLAGFETPDRGDILLEGRPIGRTPAWRRGIGVVFQNYALFPHMTAEENVAFPLRARGLSRSAIRPRVARALDLVRLSRDADRRPARLSGGQQQRVALARALVFDPKLVLLDEPLAALDRPLREEMQHELRRLHRNLGVSIIHVTHDQAEALALSDRIAVLQQGRLRQLGSPRDLYETPASAFVARFMGESNSLHGRLREMVEDGIAAIVLESGLVVEAAVAEAVAPGERCIVAIRPERIAVAAVAAADMGEGALPATVREVAYGGDHLRLSLILGEPGAGVPGAPATEIIVKRPAGAPLVGLAPGQRAAIAWQPDHARVLRPER